MVLINSRKCDLDWFLITFLEFYIKVNYSLGDTYSLENSINAIDDLFKLFVASTKLFLC